MSYVYYTDEKNQKLLLQWVAVATEVGLKKYEQLYAEREDVRNALAIIRCLHVHKKNTNRDVITFPSNWSEGYDQELYVILNTTRPSVYLHLSDLRVEDEDLQKGLPSLDFIAAIELLVSLDKNGVGEELNSWKKLRKEIDAGAYTLNHFSPLEAFSSSSSYALFCREEGGSEGYLTENGLGSLSRAITYDSLEEMEAAFNRQSRFKNYEHLQIVKIRSEVESLGELKKMLRYAPNFWCKKTNLTGASIYQIATDIQRKNIERALQQASEEQIIEAYKALKFDDKSNGEEKKNRRI